MNKSTKPIPKPNNETKSNIFCYHQVIKAIMGSDREKSNIDIAVLNKWTF